jgi:ribosomal protein L7/L12
MKIEITATRDYVGLGLREAGETVEVADDVGQQLIAQGFAREISAPRVVDVTVTDALELGDGSSA